MAIPKKKSRIMVVDAVKYRWVVKNTDPTGVRITVQSASSPGSVLTIHSDENRAAIHVLPSEVASFIYAENRGQLLTFDSAEKPRDILLAGD